MKKNPKIALFLLLLILPFPAIHINPKNINRNIASKSIESLREETDDPIYFIENVGQFDEEIRFMASMNQGKMFITKDAIWFSIIDSIPSIDQQIAEIINSSNLGFHNKDLDKNDHRINGINIKLSLPDTRTPFEFEPFGLIETTYSYFYGNDPDRWISGVPVWKGIRLINVFPGINLSLTGVENELIPEFECVNSCSFERYNSLFNIEGGKDIVLDGTSLSIENNDKWYKVPLYLPESSDNENLDNYFQPDGKRISIPLRKSNGLMDQNKASEITSDLSYSSFLGGSILQGIAHSAIDDDDYLYLIGDTYSTDFPTTSGAFDRSLSGRFDTFVVKFNTISRSVKYATYIGGNDTDSGTAIAVDDNGIAYLTGSTTSANFPVSSTAFMHYCPSNCSSGSAFITILSENGTSLLASTYLGGRYGASAETITVADDGDVFISGTTYSNNFPTSWFAYDRSLAEAPGCTPPYDIFISRMSSDLSNLEYSTYLGGGLGERVHDIAIDSSKNVYITGATGSDDFPSTKEIGSRSANDTSVFALKLSTAYGSDNEGLIYSTLFGGSDSDQAYALHLNPDNSLYISGSTKSNDFPITSNAYDKSFNGSGDSENGDGYLVKLNSKGDNFQYSSYIGGSRDDVIFSIDFDSDGYLYFLMNSRSNNLSTTYDAYDRYPNGDYDIYVGIMNKGLNGILYSSYLGGSELDFGGALHVTSNKDVVLTGSTRSENYPTTSNAFDRTINDYFDDAFVSIFSGIYPHYELVQDGQLRFRGTLAEGGRVFITIPVKNIGNIPSPGVHPYTEGYTSESSLWRADGAVPKNVAIQPNQTVNFEVQHDLWQGHIGKWSTYGVYLWNDTLNDYLSPLKPNGFSQIISFDVRHITIVRLEVSQVTNDQDAPLIENKPTIIRLYMDCGSGCGTVFNNEGALLVSGSGGSKTQLPIKNNLNVHELTNWEDDQGHPEHTFMFFIHPDLARGIVEFTPVINGIHYQAKTKQFIESQPINVSIVPIEYQPSSLLCGSGSKTPSRESIPKSVVWAEKIFPTYEINYSLLPTMFFSGNLCKPYDDSDNLFQELLKWLDTSNNQNSQVFGWLPEGYDYRYEGNAQHLQSGSENQGGRVAFGVQHADDYQQVFGHEFAHLIGRNHTQVGESKSCQNPSPSLESDWHLSGYPDARIQYWGIDPISRRLYNPEDTWDYMSYCWYEENSDPWTSSWTYTKIHEYLSNNSSILLNSNQGSVDSYYILDGTIDTDRSIVLNPIWRIEHNTFSPQNLPGSEYCFKFQDHEGLLLYEQCYDLPTKSDHAELDEGKQYFHLLTPIVEGFSQLVIYQGVDELFRTTITLNTPEVSIIKPVNGENWLDGNQFRISWNGIDLDGDNLFYRVLYSADGIDWSPLSSTITLNELVVSSEELAGGDNSRIRVLVSDGINSSYSDSNLFSVNKKPPQAFILSPENYYYNPDDNLFFQGLGYDVDDGQIKGDQLVWTSSIDGVLGKGEYLLTSLSAGIHTISLTVRDSDDMSGNASIKVISGDIIFMPLIKSEPD